MSQSPVQELARSFAIDLLKKEKAPSGELIRQRVVQAVQFAGQSGETGEVDLEGLIREFEATFSIFVADGKALDDQRDHIAWLHDKRGTIPWKFWRRYEHFLQHDEHLPIRVVQNLDRVTDQVLERLEDSQRTGPWDRRGLVVGSVQSGKTGSYIGVICKALDAGYKLIVILAGIHNSLRSQTQVRVDEGVIGFDTSRNRLYSLENRRVGVGLQRGEFLRINSLTTSENSGDFSRAVGRNIAIALGGDPYLVVVKKNSRILKNLLEWALHQNGRDDGKGGKVIRDVPLLLIDDEADNASIDIRTLARGEDLEEYKPSAINGGIRELLKSFDKSAYVGYTATPFANIFVNPDTEHELYGDDIFPRSFILTLDAPPNYVGPALVFGLEGDPDAGIEGANPLPIVRLVSDQEPFFPPRYNKDHDPGGLPDSMKQALRSFVLVCAARAARGQTRVHNSMLIHVARFVNVQRKVRDLVHEELHGLQRRIEYEERGRNAGIRAELKALWEKEFEQQSKDMNIEDCKTIAWRDLERNLHISASKIAIKEINGEAQDILDYIEHPNGRSVIAIGGDKLSRGLTLYGLSVSYYLRMSRMYDTLMQMGRWFGYRPGYLDLCRLYTTEDLVDWYRHIALADMELRREFEYMWAAGRTPRDYGLRVRTHPEGLLITALNKSRHGERMLITFTGKLIQTAHLFKSKRQTEANLEATAQLFRKLGKSTRIEGQERDARVWYEAGVGLITEFLRKFNVHPRSLEADGARLADYIDRQVKEGELTSWTVALASNSAAKRHENIGEEASVGLIKRDAEQTLNEVGDDEGRAYVLKKSNILSPVDQYIDLEGKIITQEYAASISTKSIFDAEAFQPDRDMILDAVGRPLLDVAREITVSRWERGAIRGKDRPKNANGRVVRELRPITDGMLILYPLDPDGIDGVESDLPMIGFAISFPVSDTARPVEYLVNEVYRRLNFSGLEDEPDAE